MINLEDVLLNKDDLEARCQKCIDDNERNNTQSPVTDFQVCSELGDSFCQKHFKSQCLKLLDVLIKQGLLIHTNSWIWQECPLCAKGEFCITGHSHSGWYEHEPKGCQLCSLEKLLKEG